MSTGSYYALKIRDYYVVHLQAKREERKVNDGHELILVRKKWNGIEAIISLDLPSFIQNGELKGKIEESLFGIKTISITSNSEELRTFFERHYYQDFLVADRSLFFHSGRFIFLPSEENISILVLIATVVVAVIFRRKILKTLTLESSPENL